MQGGGDKRGAERRADMGADWRDGYKTRYFMWSLLVIGWSLSVGASVMRGHMPEMFVAIVLTGMLLQGLLPVAAARASRLRVSRELSSLEAFAGGEVRVTLAFRSRIPLPLLWISIRETIVNERGAAERTVQFRHIALPWRSKEWRIHYTIKGLERGQYIFRPVGTVFGDMLGLTAVRRAVAGAGAGAAAGDPGCGLSLLVFPSWQGEIAAPAYGGRTAPIGDSRYDSASAGAYGHTGPSGGRRPMLQGAAGGSLRMPYRMGDDARRIDWRAVSRGGQWVTKRERTTSPPELLVAVDWTASAYGGDDRLFDQAAGYAAALIRTAAASGIAFRLLGLDQMQNGQRSNAGRKSGEREAMERLALARPVQGAANRETAVLTGIEKGVSRGAALIVVTAEWRNGALGERLAALAAASGCRAELHVLTDKKLPSLAMRERKRDWESAGMRVVWAVMPESGQEPYKGAVAEGGDASDEANG